MDVTIQEKIYITIISLKKIICTMPNWMSSVWQLVQGLWLKKISSLQERIQSQLEVFTWWFYAQLDDEKEACINVEKEEHREYNK